MAIHVYTDDARGLLDALYALIDEGYIQTWGYDWEGDFTHADQWRYGAWLIPDAKSNELTLNILVSRDVRGAISTEVYALYHGRFIETLLAYVKDRFDRILCSALPEPADWIGS
jgi:hypothetical protein